MNPSRCSGEGTEEPGGQTPILVSEKLSLEELRDKKLVVSCVASSELVSPSSAL